MNKYVVVLALSLVVGIASAEVYRWQDDKGRWHFTDKADESSSAEKIDLKPLNGMTAVEIPEGLFK